MLIGLAFVVGWLLGLAWGHWPARGLAPNERLARLRHLTSHDCQH